MHQGALWRRNSRGKGRKKRRKHGPVVNSVCKCLIKREERRGRKVIQDETKVKGA